ncbi:MAG: GNAT family N-acetyltransferase [Acidimicrobiales bacterium]
MPTEPDTQPPILTPRLVLHHVSAPRLIALFEEPESSAVYEGCPYVNPHRVLVDEPGLVRWRASQVMGDVTLNKWFLRWMVDKHSGVIVGSTSFHGAPDARGMVEIGLGVHPEFQGRGFAREALVGMWSWVSEQADVRVLRYTVSAANVASTKLIARFGFEHTGVQLDHEAGPEEVFEMSAHEFRERFATRWWSDSKSIVVDAPSD